MLKLLLKHLKLEPLEHREVVSVAHSPVVVVVNASLPNGVVASGSGGVESPVISLDDEENLCEV